MNIPNLLVKKTLLFFLFVSLFTCVLVGFISYTNLRQHPVLYMQTLSLLILMIVSAIIMYIIATHFIWSNRHIQSNLNQLNQALEDRVQAATQKIQEREQRFLSVLDNMLEGCQIIDFHWKYIYVNDAAAQHGRTTQEDLLGYTMMEKYPGIQDTALFHHLHKCLLSRQPQRLENVFTYPDGNIGYFDVSIEPIPEGLFILSIDISERKRREYERAETFDEYQQILFKISHEMRQPVVQILGLADLLNKAELSQPELQEITIFMQFSVNLLDKQSKELTLFIDGIKKNKVI